MYCYGTSIEVARKDLGLLHGQRGKRHSGDIIKISSTRTPGHQMGERAPFPFRSVRYGKTPIALLNVSHQVRQEAHRVCLSHNYLLVEPDYIPIFQRWSLVENQAMAVRRITLKPDRSWSDYQDWKHAPFEYTRRGWQRVKRRVSNNPTALWNLEGSDTFDFLKDCSHLQ